MMIYDWGPNPPILDWPILVVQAMQSAAARKSEIALRAELDVKNHEAICQVAFWWYWGGKRWVCSNTSFIL